ncbi:MAG: hypothetical protein JWO05_1946 [Gemmatimonadetes bacterium]|nr:hypothetical protein [Gemmatimonadota bacterium]
MSVETSAAGRGYLDLAPCKANSDPSRVNPLPGVPWQITGNHWIALPCVHPVDGSIHALGVLHRGARAAIEFAGGPDFIHGSAAPLARPTLVIDGVKHELSSAPMAWERALQWLPTFTSTVGPVVLRGTVFAPFGRDTDSAGVVYALSLETRGDRALHVQVGLEGTLGHRQLRVRTPRAFEDPHRASVTNDVVVLEGTALPGLVSLAVGADGPATLEVTEGEAPRYAVTREVVIEPNQRVQVAFYLAAGPERDGADAAVAVLRRRGWRELLAGTRDALQSLEQVTGNEQMDRLINRNLLFAYFFAVGRALDDAHYYLVRTRVPWHARGVTVRDWEALAWVVPAVQLADAPLARELILRACELHGYAPGRGVHYMDGTLFEPGFSLEGAASFALAADRYIRETGDDQIVEEPALADTLYLSHEDLVERRDRQVPLYAAEVNAAGEPLPQPYPLHGNAVVALALDVFRRTLDEETAAGVEDPAAVRAALRRHFAAERGGRSAFNATVDLAGASSGPDDPHASALWLPLYDAVDRQDSLYRRTVKGLGAEPRELVLQCARLVGPEAQDVLQWLRRAPLDGGFAAEVVDAEGKGIANGGDASLSALLAWSAWYAVHALGERP